MTRPIIEQRTIFFLAVEGEGEQSFIKWLQWLSDRKGLHVHLDCQHLGGGRYKTMLDNTMRYRKHKGRNKAKSSILLAPIEIQDLSIRNSLLSNEKDRVKFIMHTIINHITHLYVAALSQGIALRRGVALGEIYYDKPGNLIIGKPLIEATRAEEELANYPRIILAQSMLDQLRPKNFYKESADGLLYVDWLNPIIFQAKRKNGQDITLLDINFKMLNNFKNQIQKNLQNNKSNLKILSKWVWLANYFNREIK